MLETTQHISLWWIFFPLALHCVVLLVLVVWDD